MRKTLLFGPLLILVVSQGHCQDLAKAPAFEVASITPCKPGTPALPGQDRGMFQFALPGGRFTARATTVQLLFEWAYGVMPWQHSGGPSWLDDDRYDIIAKAAGNATDDEMKRMLQTLLVERFKLKFHRETRDAPVLILSAGKTPPKLFPPKEGESRSLKIIPTSGEDKKIVTWRTIATRYSFDQLNQTFARQLGRTIVNQTGLAGDFDFTLDFVPDEERPNPLDPAIIISAMRDQLGLVVKAQRGPVEFLVIDSLEKVAAGN
jgi:uncharacterized protein (TIGR03435 family)